MSIPAIQAALSGNAELMSVLLAHKADINLPGTNGATAVMLVRVMLVRVMMMFKVVVMIRVMVMIVTVIRVVCCVFLSAYNVMLMVLTMLIP